MSEDHFRSVVRISRGNTWKFPPLIIRLCILNNHQKDWFICVISRMNQQQCDIVFNHQTMVTHIARDCHKSWLKCVLIDISLISSCLCDRLWNLCHSHFSCSCSPHTFVSWSVIDHRGFFLLVQWSTYFITRIMIITFLLFAWETSSI